MGCCVSTAADDHPKPTDSKSPLPSLDAEAVVKEVLSETPKPKPVTQPQNDFRHAKTTKPITPARIQQHNENENEHEFEFDKKLPPSSDPLEIHRQISQVLSEICSFTAKPDDDVTIRSSPSPSTLRHPRPFSPAKTERVVGKSPTRRLSDHSPGRKNGSVRALQGGREAATKTGLWTEPNSADRTVRRSRSPALRSESGSSKSNNMGRNPTDKRINQSPGRVGNDSPESSSAKESLENPVVSLECFIFL